MRPISCFVAMTLAATVLPAAVARAADPAATMNKVNAEGVGDAVGTVAVSMSAVGAVLKLDLKGLPPGAHGMHIHDGGACGPTMANGAAVPAGAAGGHWDSGHTGKHEGPAGQGHIGDLPVLEVAADGSAKASLTAPHVKDLEAMRGHALVIHAGGDNFSDQPAALGGGGARIACGVIR